VTRIHLAVEDVVEFAELLQSVLDWLATDQAAAASLARFAGSEYSPQSPRSDLDRFAFLLGGHDGERWLRPD
jgi:hypothetical protein